MLQTINWIWGWIEWLLGCVSVMVSCVLSLLYQTVCWLYPCFVCISCRFIIAVSILKYIVVLWNYCHYFPDMPPSLSLIKSQLLLDEQNTTFKFSNERYKPELSFYVPTVEVRNLSHEYIDLLEKGWEGMDIKIRYISVLRSPLEDLYQSSHVFVSEKLRRYWTGGDYHAFVSFATDDGMVWALDRDREGIHISWSTATVTEYDPLYTVMRCRSSATLRAIPVEFLSQAFTWPHNERSDGYPMKNFTDFLRREVNRPYDLFENNCQDFSSRAINVVAQMHVWESTQKFHLLFDAELEENAMMLLDIFIGINLFFLVFCGNIKARRIIRKIFIASLFWITSPTLHPWKVSLSLDFDKLKPKVARPPVPMHRIRETEPLRGGEIAMLFIFIFFHTLSRQCATLASLLCLWMLLEHPWFITAQFETDLDGF